MRPIIMRSISCPSIAAVAAFALCLGLNLWLLPANPAHADGSTVPESAEDDQETARKALENKEILPLGEVLARIQAAYTGDVVEIELERKLGKWVYEIEIIDTDGRVREIDVDGRTAEVLTIEFEK